jgi:hypothetical protein
VAVESVDVTLHLTHGDDGAMLIRRTLGIGGAVDAAQSPPGRDRRKDTRHVDPQGRHASTPAGLIFIPRGTCSRLAGSNSKLSRVTIPGMI